MTTEIEKRMFTENDLIRDAVVGRLFDLSEQQDSRIIFLTADMSGKAHLEWREREEKLKDGRFREFGIAEFGMASFAAGLAKEGYRPFIYSIGNFNTKRILESHILNAGVQNLPYVTIGVGTGFSYPDSGPTHYMLEDIAIMRIVPNMEIFSPSDSIMAAEITEMVANSDNPAYIRVERRGNLPVHYKPTDSFEEGFTELKKGGRKVIVATGITVPRALEVHEELQRRGENVGVVDLYRIKPLNVSGLAETLSQYDEAVSLEEHFLNGGIGSIISEMITDNRLNLRLTRIGVDDKIPYLYGRDNIHKQLGLDVYSVIKKIDCV